MITITGTDIIYGCCKGTDVVYGDLDTPLIKHLQNWYMKNMQHVEWDGTVVEVAFYHFIKYHFNPMTLDWKTESNTYKVIDKQDHNIYRRRVKHGGNRPRTQYNKK